MLLSDLTNPLWALPLTNSMSYFCQQTSSLWNENSILSLWQLEDITSTWVLPILPSKTTPEYPPVTDWRSIPKESLETAVQSNQHQVKVNKKFVLPPPSPHNLPFGWSSSKFILSSGQFSQAWYLFFQFPFGKCYSGPNMPRIQDHTNYDTFLYFPPLLLFWSLLSDLLMHFL